MNANEFVKKYGIEYAKHILLEDSVILVDLDYENLKRIVESHELVEKFGGLFQAKAILDKEGFTGGIELNDDLISDEELTQAIADVESCK